MQTHKAKLYNVRLNNGGYESDGTYWGIGPKLYRMEIEDLDMIDEVRADNRTEAADKFIKKYGHQLDFHFKGIED